jgi:hypothetical protein
LHKSLHNYKNSLTQTGINLFKDIIVDNCYKEIMSIISDLLERYRNGEEIDQ